MDMRPVKTCPDCGNTFPNTSENFNKCKAFKDGLYNICKWCRAKRRKPQEDALREQTNTRKRERYANDPAYRRHRAELKKLPKHRDTRNKHRRERYANDAEYRLKTNRVTKERHQKRYAQSAEYRKRRKQNFERWKKQPQGQLSLSAAVERRRARKRELAYDWIVADWEYTLEYWGHSCAVCGQPATLWSTLAMDHWIPVSQGGGTTPSNILPLCHTNVKGGFPGCNNFKSSRDPAEWVQERLGKRKAKQKLAEIEAFFKTVRQVK